MVPSLADEASKRRSTLNAMASTHPLCPVRGSPTALRDAGSHNRTSLSAPPDASSRPSGLKASVSMLPAGPVSGAPIGAPVAVSHSWISKSSADARACPSGLKATARTPVLSLVQWCADSVAGGNVPQPHGLVVSTRGSCFPSGLNTTQFTPPS